MNSFYKIPNSFGLPYSKIANYIVLDPAIRVYYILSKVNIPNIEISQSF